MSNMQKYPSLASMASTATAQTLFPPGYVFKKPKPEKPYGPSPLTLLNRTYIGPGKPYCKYAFAFLIAMVLFGAAGITYLGLRNVSRMIVYRTEMLGPLCLAAALLCIGMASHCFYSARLASNRWRAQLRFKPLGMDEVVPYNTEDPENELEKNLKTGTFSPQALQDIPRGQRKANTRGGSRAPSMMSLTSGRTFGSRLDRSQIGLLNVSMTEKLATVEESPQYRPMGLGPPPSAGPRTRPPQEGEPPSIISGPPSMMGGPQPMRTGPTPMMGSPASSEPSPHMMGGPPPPMMGMGPRPGQIRMGSREDIRRPMGPPPGMGSRENIRMRYMGPPPGMGSREDMRMRPMGPPGMGPPGMGPPRMGPPGMGPPRMGPPGYPRGPFPRGPPPPRPNLNSSFGSIGPPPEMGRSSPVLVHRGPAPGINLSRPPVDESSL